VGAESDAADSGRRLLITTAFSSAMANRGGKGSYPPSKSGASNGRQNNSNDVIHLSDSDSDSDGNNIAQLLINFFPGNSLFIGLNPFYFQLTLSFL
uniref:Uncharacterized protein n=1 Tax=Aegilops tauschii subsp. strangulata TaxID=200361 RepID=A0A453PG72_AEGTS